MTEFDEFLADVTYPERSVIGIAYDEVDFDSYDTMPSVIVITSPTGEHCVIAPFIMPGDLTAEIALFDAAGVKVRHRLLSVMGADQPFVTGA